MPESVTLELSTPPGFPSAEAFRKLLNAALTASEAEAVKKFGTFLGAARIRAQKFTARALRPEPLGQLNPRVAGRDKWKRIERLTRLVGFLNDYRAALGEWRAGKRDTLFPAGTYLMRVAWGAACVGAG